MRVPMLVRYPGNKTAEMVSDELVLNIDLATTFLDIAGAKIPKEIEGESLAPFAQAKKTELRSRFFYEYFFENRFTQTLSAFAYRTKTTKIIIYPEQDEWTELYDIIIDPSEVNDLSHSPDHKDLLSRMKTEYEKEKNAVGYIVLEHAEKSWPADNTHIKKKQIHPWLKR